MTSLVLMYFPEILPQKKSIRSQLYDSEPLTRSTKKQCATS